MLADAVGLRCRKRIPGIVFTARCIRYFPIFQRYVLPHREDLSREDSLSLLLWLSAQPALAGPLPPGARLTPSFPARKNKCQAAESACLRTQLAFSQSLFLFRARSHSHAHSNLRTQTQFSSPSLSRALSNFLSISLVLSQARA